MANKLPSFLSGAQLVIRLGESTVAFAQALSFSHNMNLAPVGGIGAYSYHTLEPLQYAAQGSLVITRYSRLMSSKDAFSTASNAANVGKKTGTSVTKDPGSAPDPIIGANSEKVGSNVVRGGNTMLLHRHFNPVQLLLSQTFDITVHARLYNAGAAFDNAGDLGPILYTIQNARCTGYSTGLNPGSLMTETMSYIAMRVKDHGVDA